MTAEPAAALPHLGSPLVGCSSPCNSSGGAWLAVAATLLRQEKWRTTYTSDASASKGACGTGTLQPPSGEATHLGSTRASLPLCVRQLAMSMSATASPSCAAEGWQHAVHQLRARQRHASHAAGALERNKHRASPLASSAPCSRGTREMFCAGWRSVPQGVMAGVGQAPGQVRYGRPMHASTTCPPPATAPPTSHPRGNGRPVPWC